MRLHGPLALVLTLAACGGGSDHRGDESLHAELRLSPTPPMVGTAGVAVRATDGGEELTPPAEVSVRVRGGPGPAEILEFQDGSWAGTLEFVEPGEVRVDIAVTAPDGRTATLGIPVRVVRRP